MRLFRTLAAVALFALPVFAQDAGAADAAPERQKHAYQSDVARLRKIVINRFATSLLSTIYAYMLTLYTDIQSILSPRYLLA
jgi:hypothetical protein